MTDTYNYLSLAATLATGTIITWNLYHRISGQPDIFPIVETAFKAAKATTTTASRTQHSGPSIILVISLFGVMIILGFASTYLNFYHYHVRHSQVIPHPSGGQEGIEEVTENVEDQLQEAHQRRSAPEVEIESHEESVNDADSARDDTIEITQDFQLDLNDSQNQVGELRKDLKLSKMELQKITKHSIETADEFQTRLDESQNQTNELRKKLEVSEMELEKSSKRSIESADDFQTRLNESKSHIDDVEKALELSGLSLEKSTKRASLCEKERIVLEEKVNIYEVRLTGATAQIDDLQKQLDDSQEKYDSDLNGLELEKSSLEHWHAEDLKDLRTQHEEEVYCLEIDQRTCNRQRIRLVEECQSLKELHQARYRKLKQDNQANAHAAKSLEIIKSQQRRVGEFVQKERAELQEVQKAYDAIFPKLKSSQDAVAALQAENLLLRGNQPSPSAEKRNVQSSARSVERTRRRVKLFARSQARFKEAPKNGPTCGSSATLPLSPVESPASVNAPIASFEEPAEDVHAQRSASETISATSPASITEQKSDLPPVPAINVTPPSPPHTLDADSTVDLPPVPVKNATENTQGLLVPSHKVPAQRKRKRKSRASTPPEQTTEAEEEPKIQSDSPECKKARLFHESVGNNSTVTHSYEPGTSAQQPILIDNDEQVVPDREDASSSKDVSSAQQPTHAVTDQMAVDSEDKKLNKDVSSAQQPISTNVEQMAVDSEGKDTSMVLSSAQQPAPVDDEQMVLDSADTNGCEPRSIDQQPVATDNERMMVDSGNADEQPEPVDDEQMVVDSGDASVSSAQHPALVYNERMEIDSRDPGLPAFTPSQYQAQLSILERGHSPQMQASEASPAAQGNSMSTQRQAVPLAAQAVVVTTGANSSSHASSMPTSSSTPSSVTESAKAKPPVSPNPEVRYPTLEYWRSRCTGETEARKMLKQDMAKYMKKCEALAAENPSATMNAETASSSNQAPPTPNSTPPIPATPAAGQNIRMQQNSGGDGSSGGPIPSQPVASDGSNIDLENYEMPELPEFDEDDNIIFPNDDEESTVPE